MSSFLFALANPKNSIASRAFIFSLLSSISDPFSVLTALIAVLPGRTILRRHDLVADATLCSYFRPDSMLRKSNLPLGSFMTQLSNKTTEPFQASLLFDQRTSFFSRMLIASPHVCGYYGRFAILANMPVHFRPGTAAGIAE